MRKPQAGRKRITLTPEEELYCKRVSEGNAKLHSYLEAFGGCGDSENDIRLWYNVDRRVPVRMRIKELIEQKKKMDARAAEIAGSALAVDKFWVMKELIENVRTLKEEKMFISVHRPLELIGKELGMFIDRKEIRTGQLDKLTDEQLGQLITALDSGIPTGALDVFGKARTGAEDQGESTTVLPPLH